MNHIPIIKVELEGIRQSVGAMLVDRNKELSDVVIKSLEKQLTEEWVIDEIDTAVKCCIKASIANIANDYNMKVAITELISSAVTKKLNGSKS